MVEDAIHYFFHCRKFTIKRQVFNDTVRVFRHLSIDMILCGNYNLNMVVFRAVHRYIHATKHLKPVDSLFEIFLKQIWYINKYTYDQMYYIPKLKGFLAVVLFFVFLIIKTAAYVLSTLVEGN